MADPMTTFDYAKALEVVKDNPFAKDFLEQNKARLTELGTQAGQAVLLEIIALFAAGKNRDAWAKFYNRDSSWSTLASGAVDDVTNTAEMAARWNALGEFFQEAGILAAKALLSILVAGFLG